MKKTGIKKAVFCIAGAAVIVAVCGWFCCGSKVGVVDMARVKNEADVYRAVISKRDGYEQDLRRRVQGEFEKLQQADKKLTDRRKKLSDDAFRKQTADLQKQVAALQAQLQTEMRQIAFAAQVAVSQAEKDIKAVAGKVARKAGASVLIDASPVVYAKDERDLTDAFIRGLNAAHIAVNYPDPKLIRVERK